MNRRRVLRIFVALIRSLPSMWSRLLGPRTSAAATAPRPVFDRLILSGLSKRFGPAQTENQRQTREGSVTACRVRRGAVEPVLRPHFQGTEESVLPWKQGRADAESRLGGLDRASTRWRPSRPTCIGGGQFRPREQSETFKVVHPDEHHKDALCSSSSTEFCK